MVAHDISRLDAFVASSCRQGLRVDGHWAIRCAQAGLGTRGVSAVGSGTLRSPPTSRRMLADFETDRKSTRLNSSHITISYAVFCLKKKNTKITSRLSAISACLRTTTI